MQVYLTLAPSHPFFPGSIFSISFLDLQFLLFVGRENQALCDLATENCGHLPTGDALFSPEWKDEA